jgi:hypothetical protein
MAVKRVDNPGESAAPTPGKAAIGCWGGCWYGGCWGGCWPGVKADPEIVDFARSISRMEDLQKLDIAQFAEGLASEEE